MKKVIENTKSLTIFVGACLVLVILYIITAVAVQVITGQPLSDSLTAGTFALFGSELAVTGFIKVAKIRKENE